MITNDVLEKHLRKTTITSNVISITVALLVALGVGYGFYYNTTFSLKKHQTDINDIKKDVNIIHDHVNEMDVYKGVSKVELQGLEDKVIKLEVVVEKMDDKLDRIILQTR